MFDDLNNSTKDQGDKDKQTEDSSAPAEAPAPPNQGIEPNAPATEEPAPEPPVSPSQSPLAEAAQSSPESGPAGDEAAKPNLEDIFSDTESKEKPAVFQPKESSVEADNISAPEPTQSKTVKKIMLPIALVLGIAVIGVGGVFGYRYTIKLIGGQLPSNEEALTPGPADSPEPAPAPEPTPVSKPAPAPEPGPEPSPAPIPTPEPARSSQDRDKDGLTDQEEVELGTNINNVDTDADGLFDREEVKVYLTDPLKPDTDGDGFLDGAEVKDGYNPNGPGKLYEIDE